MVDQQRCKFLVDRSVYQGVRRFASRAEAQGSPLAEALYAIPGVSDANLQSSVLGLGDLLAEKFGLPVLTFIDTPGAAPGIGDVVAEDDQAVVVLTHAELAVAQVVQLPTFNFFGISTTVSVPDSGAGFVGGNSISSIAGRAPVSSLTGWPPPRSSG